MTFTTLRPAAWINFKPVCLPYISTMSATCSDHITVGAPVQIYTVYTPSATVTLCSAVLPGQLP